MDELDTKRLLTLARQTMASYLLEEPLPPLPELAVRAELGEFGGVFVTIRNGTRLRGCIGRFHPDQGLAATVQSMAAAALGDPRFRSNPVTYEELPQLRIEVSVLTKMERTADPLSLEPGKHGIYIRRGLQAGCFLPQVATELHWDAKTFLSRCCVDKAGLPADAWRDPATEVYLFKSEVFEE